MSIFFQGFFVNKQVQSEESVKTQFQSVWTTETSNWWACNWGRDFIDGLFEPDNYLTTEKSESLGDVIFLCMDTQNDQFDYEHSRDGQLIRKLCWCFDGNESTWMTLEGQLEEWEKDSLFGPHNLEATLKYLGFVTEDEPEDVQLKRQQEIKDLFERREYQLDAPWPRGDAYFALLIAKAYGIELPEKIGG